MMQNEDEDARNSSQRSPRPSVIELPEDLDVPVWRYMSLFKYVDLLRTRSLYFATHEELRRDDPYESVVPDETIRSMLSAAQRSGDTEAVITRVSKHVEQAARSLRVNCWHMNRNESMAMWQLYGGRGDGLCVRTTFRKLRSALPKGAVIGCVRYGSHRSMYLYDIVLHKRPCFEHESEVRAVLITDACGGKSGSHCRVDLSTILEDVLLAPSAPDFYESCIRELNSRFGFADVRVARSKLLEAPSRTRDAARRP